MNQQSQYPDNKTGAYKQFLKELTYTIEKDLPLVSSLSNLSAQLNQLLKNVNWVGFYLYENEQLFLGPFQGLPACTKIKMGNGVCGAAAEKKETFIVEDVHRFAGHIACDAASNSEIVIPIYDTETVYGVLDVDSYLYNNFDEIDKQYLELIVEKYILPLFQKR